MKWKYLIPLYGFNLFCKEDLFEEPLSEPNSKLLQFMIYYHGITTGLIAIGFIIGLALIVKPYHG